MRIDQPPKCMKNAVSTMLKIKIKMHVQMLMSPE